MTGKLDDLDHREGLPAEFLFLRERHPREAWQREAAIGSMARMWLERHDWFRKATRTITAGAGEYREGHGGLQQFHRFVRPRLELLLAHLEGHHQVEDHTYFPIFARAEPRIARGIDLLEADHQLIHGKLHAMEMSLASFGESLRLDRTDAARSQADLLVRDIEVFLRPLERHLLDEEDIVVPLMIDRPGF